MSGTRFRTVSAVALAAALSVTACGGSDDGDSTTQPDALEDRTGLTPTYAPTTASVAGSTSTSSTVAGGTGSASTVATASTQPAEPSATVADPLGDRTAAAGGTPPWAELTGGTLTRKPSHYELRVRLGAAAPTSSGSADRTMNVAAFFDVDGDGQVDYEVWANLSDGGWDGSWFDDRTGAAAFSDAAATDVLVEAGELVVRFPPEYVGGAEAFRWSLASEYGTYVELGTNLTARDDAPDDDAAVAFPA